MTAIILLPINDSGHLYARIYRADSVDGEYTLINTVNAGQLEYDDSDGDYSKYYKTAWYDGTVESTQVPVQSFVQKVIDLVRIECKINATSLSDPDIEYLVDQAKLAIQMDICKFYYGVQLVKLEQDGYYKLPGAYFFDINYGGIVSILDFELFKQAIPIYPYTPKVPVEILDVDIREYYIKTLPLASNEILKINFYATGRPTNSALIYKLIAYKITAIYFQNLANASITTAASSPFAKVRIGDITVENGSSTSAGTSITAIVDLANKMNAKYKDLLNNFKTGFFRVN